MIKEIVKHYFNIKSLTKQISKYRLYIFLSGLSLAIFLSNSIYIAYPDEFVNVLGGKIILQGLLPYKDYFDHHMPFAWYLGSLLLFISKGNFIIFRILWGVLQYLLYLMLGLWIFRNHKKFALWYFVYLLVVPAFNEYFWLHLFLGDALAAIFFTVSMIMIFLETLERSNSKLIWIVAPLSVTLLIFSSLSFLYLGIVLLLWIAYLYFDHELKREWESILKVKNLKRISLLVFVFVLPYFIYGGYLLITGSFKDFLFANFTYNTEHYISIDGYARAARFNPIRFSLTLINNFWKAFLPSIGQLSDLTLYQPIAKMSSLALFFLMLIFFRRSKIYGVLYLLTISFLAPRSSQLVLAKETDYQMGVYLTAGFFASFFVLYVITTLYKEEKYPYKKIVNGVAYIWIGLYLLSSILFMLYNSYSVWYGRYMGTLPPIVNYSYVAEYIDNLVSPGETYWIGPFEAHNHYFVKKGKFASKYPSLLPQFAESDYLRNDFINEMERTKPTLIVFKHAMGIFGTPADKFGAFFLDWMKGKYVSCKELKILCKQNLRDFDVVGDVYVRKDRMDIIEKIK
ncbi:MAG: hypothetical protein U0525_00345 [Patescibacteria group bacterium]